MLAIKQKKCKVCRGLFKPFQPLQQVCGVECAKVEGKRRSQKQAEAKRKQEVRATREAKQKIKPVPKLRQEAQAAFNAYIRFRDKDEACICCGLPLINPADVFSVGGGYDCGHFRSVGSAPHLRFDERNAYGQRKYCNRWLSGNAVGMRQGIIKRKGLAFVEELEADQSVKHYAREDLIKIRDYYKQKLKLLKRGEA